VVALDVGYGQLHWKIREDERVTVVEKTNIRYADPASLGAPFGVVVADLSFISLHLVSPQLAGLGDRDTDWVLLVKPQFEVGREQVGSGGVVREPAAHRNAIDRSIAGLAAEGVGAIDVTRSPITGAAGNVEFLIWARNGLVALGDERIAAVVEGRS
jgi:23S rRNA (cytidine1920-2'-O)/16S rRNA (cytidine1409-2'-O)-methyltransferase